MRITTLLFIISFSAVANASVIEELLDQLKTELKTEAIAAREKGDDRNQQQFYRMQELLMQIQRSPSSDDGDSNLQQSVEALSNFTLSEKIEGICKALAAELRTAQEKREQSLTEEMQKNFRCGAPDNALRGKRPRTSMGL